MMTEAAVTHVSFCGSLRSLRSSADAANIRTLRRLGSIRRLQVTIEPLEDPAVDVQGVGSRVARQAVVAVRVGDELRRLSELAQRVEHHLAFTEQDRQILLAVQNQDRRGDPVEVKERRL